MTTYIVERRKCKVITRTSTITGILSPPPRSCRGVMGANTTADLRTQAGKRGAGWSAHNLTSIPGHLQESRCVRACCSVADAKSSGPRYPD